MTRLLVLTALAVTMAGTSAATTAKSAVAQKQHAHWIKAWTRTDQSIYPAVHRAALIFGASEWTLRTIVSREGGNVNPRTLHRSLCMGGRSTGWNTQGSNAFGAFQFMLDAKPACLGGWGTFASYVHAAFLTAKKLGHPVPARFKTPASNVGQAITAAYMIANGGIHHWCASMC